MAEKVKAMEKLKDLKLAKIAEEFGYVTALSPERWVLAIHIELEFFSIKLR
jgi:hypothetical protein